MIAEIPQKVIELASPYIENDAGEVRYIGIYQGLEIYLLFFFEDVDTGFPILFSFDEGNNIAREINSFEALSISRLLIKD